MAIGAGTNVAIEGYPTSRWYRADLWGIVDAIMLSRRTMRVIRQNLFWAFFYNAALSFLWLPAHSIPRSTSS